MNMSFSNSISTVVGKKKCIKNDIPFKYILPSHKVFKK